MQKRVNAALQWTMMTSLVLYFLTFVNEFRYIAIRHEIKLTERRIQSGAHGVVV